MAQTLASPGPVRHQPLKECTDPALLETKDSLRAQCGLDYKTNNLKKIQSTGELHEYTLISSNSKRKIRMPGTWNF